MTAITILISLYNAAADWPACWRSIQQQTLTDWECLVINDGSNDETAALLAETAAQDARLRVLTNARNIGLTASLNRGLQAAQGTYIARLDADDRSRPARLAQQSAFLQHTPAVGVVGGAYEEHRAEASRIVTPPRTHTGIVWQMGFQNALMHPAVMARRDLLLRVGGYDEGLRYAQDYDLWLRLIPYTRFANLPDVMIDYAVHPQQISQARHGEQQALADTISQQRLEAILGEALPLETVQSLRRWYTQMPRILTRDDLRTMGLYFRLLDHLAADAALDRAELGRIRRYWHARIARPHPAFADIAAAGWRREDTWGVGWRRLWHRVRG